MEGTVNQRDPTSELSAYLIHEILNLLPTRDAARTSVLSKAWKTAWDSFPYLDFDQENFPDYNGFSLPDDIDSNNFIEFIDSTMEKLQNRDLKIFKFRLFIDLKDVKKASPFFDQWMSFVSMSTITELDFQLHYPLVQSYFLPKSIYGVMSITVLKLRGVKLQPCGCEEIKFSNLKVLCLDSVYLEDQTLLNLISSCPLINELRIDKCCGLTNVKNDIHMPSLLTFDLADQDGYLIWEFKTKKCENWEFKTKKCENVKM
ncbi:FBD-associated F-box protein [Quillaja saponaria]|uniref:FBD-associated F-box protein n=1 Tax=Quillaja saponaria TaxID=32244 RepID=A0AAD7LTK1_QUISA|nr:FBD-associated F-box protein [Quillaja saponaria]